MKSSVFVGVMFFKTFQIKISFKNYSLYGMKQISFKIVYFVGFFHSREKIANRKNYVNECRFANQYQNML